MNEDKVTLFPPMNFGVVEDELFRCSIPDVINYEVRVVAVVVAVSAVAS
jgi:hypothetical protein